MSKIVRIPHDALIVVCDAHKALFLKNAGAIAEPQLQIEESFEYAREDIAMEDSDRPGRRFDGSASGGARSAMETSDFETRQAETFADKVLSAVARRHEQQPIGGLILAAPPAFLGILRRKMPENLKQRITAELDKDLAEMPVSELQKVLLKSL